MNQSETFQNNYKLASEFAIRYAEKYFNEYKTQTAENLSVDKITFAECAAREHLSTMGYKKINEVVLRSHIEASVDKVKTLILQEQIQKNMTRNELELTKVAG